MFRRAFLRSAALTGFAMLAARGRASAAAAQRPPNVVFVLVDDLGWGDLGCYGSTIAKTPNIDQIAAEGLRFSSFYVNSPVCSPSRTGFMTGCFPSELEIHSHFAKPEQNAERGMPQALDPDTITLADCLKSAGYATGHFGKWHLGNIAPSEYGFDAYRVAAGGDIRGWEPSPDFWRCSSEWIMDAALEFIQKHRGEPFYVNIWTIQPHAPLDPSEEQMAPFDRWKDERLTGTFTTPFGVFYGAVAEVDRQVGRLLDQLDALGLADNTILVFSSDNGPEDIHLAESAHSGVGSPGPFRGRKRSLYEGGIRTPFIIRWPGKVPAAGLDETTVLSGVDFLPSICGLLGVAAPDIAGRDGEDMSSVLLGQPRERTTPLFWERRFRVLGDAINMSPMMAIREGSWKLLMNPDHSRVELYDIPHDPMEVDNVAAQHPEVVERLTAKLLEWHNALPAGPIEPEAGALRMPWPK